jgi:hypothetical protein
MELEAKSRKRVCTPARTARTLKTHIETVHEKRRDHASPDCKGVVFGSKGVA